MCNTCGKEDKAHYRPCVNTKTGVDGHMSVFTVGLCSIVTTMPYETSLTKSLDGAHAKLSPQGCSVGLPREAPAFMRGESSQL